MQYNSNWKNETFMELTMIHGDQPMYQKIFASMVALLLTHRTAFGPLLDAAWQQTPLTLLMDAAWQRTPLTLWVDHVWQRDLFTPVSRRILFIIEMEFKVDPQAHSLLIGLLCLSFQFTSQNYLWKEYISVGWHQSTDDSVL
jgi:hypothetical protein